MPAPADTRTYATGKRKTAVARVWIRAGGGGFTVNGRPTDDYFRRVSLRTVIRQPLDLIEAAEQYDVVAQVFGGGQSAQADAIRHGIARALASLDPERRTTLKKAGYLTRDARKRERKKYGQPGARRRFQYSKR